MGPFYAVHFPATCYLLAALIPSWSRVQSLCFMGRFSATVTLWGCNERMKSKGNILTPKIHLRGRNGRNLLGDFPQQICLCVSFLSLHRECFIWSGPYCPGRRHCCGRTKQRCLSFQIPPQCNLEGGGGGLVKKQPRKRCGAAVNIQLVRRSVSFCDCTQH